MNGGVKLKLHSFLTSAVDGGEQSASRFGHLPALKVAPSIIQLFRENSE
jgi:hypothetical protein